MPASVQRIAFQGRSGASLAARLELPNGPVRGYALFVHCFTCSKDQVAARRISADLAREGLAVMRFDFTGLGDSEGDFASTNFSSNVADIHSAADYLRDHYEAPAILIGHSLGGAAVLAAAKDVPEVRAVVTIGAPAEPDHLLKTLGVDADEIAARGEAEAELNGSRFRIARQFAEDLQSHRLAEAIRAMRKPLLILHSPLDRTVDIENATQIFLAARHPKSFVSLDRADHLLTKTEDVAFAAQVITGWSTRYLAADEPQGEEALEHVRVMETGVGKFQNAIQAGRHRLFADEPESVGGMDSGPSPYDYLSIALGACTAMTIRLYAQMKGLELGRVRVDVSHEKIHVRDGDAVAGVPKSKIDCFSRVITVDGEVTEELAAKIEEIAGKCPVHRTLEARSEVRTEVRSATAA